MKIKICKNKKCERRLPEEYKYKYCENCRNMHVKRIKDTGRLLASVAAVIGGVAINIVKRGKKE